MHQNRLVSLLVAALGLILTASGLANASPITYDFSVMATTGPLSGTSENGTFTFDSSIMANFINHQTGLLTALDFSWSGIHYDENTANTGSLDPLGTGVLHTVLFGTNCFPGACVVTGGNEWSLFQAVDTGLNQFVYSVSGTPGQFLGTVTIIPPHIPEPSSLALLVAALVGLGLIGNSAMCRP